MPEFSLFLLNPNAPFHLGERGVGLEETSIIAHSDTVFGAICWAWRLLHGEDDLVDLLNLYNQFRPPFIISSAFPFIGKTLLLPKLLDGLGHAGHEKTVRESSFVSFSIFQSLSSGKKLENYKIVHGDPESAIVTTEEESAIRQLVGQNFPWTARESPRVTLDRNSRQSEIYYAGDLRFKKGCGLYILVNFLDASYRTKFEGALRLLGDEGLGGERSSGRGFFTFDSGSLSIGSDAGNKAALLSLYRPQEQEVRDSIMQNSSYRLVSRRGWIGAKSAMRKKSLRMFAEGSVIPYISGRLLGSIEDVGTIEGNKMYSYGLAFQVPMRIAL